MTKPVTEPTPARESANYGWRIRQLERRPAHQGEINYARVSFDSGISGPITVPDSTATPITPMTSGFTTDPTILQIDLAAGVIWWDFDQRTRPAVATAQALWDGGDPDYPGYRLTRLYGSGGFPTLDERNGGDYPGDLAWQTACMNWLLGMEEGDTGSTTMGVYHEMGGDVDILYAEINMFVWTIKETTVYP